MAVLADDAVYMYSSGLMVSTLTDWTPGSTAATEFGRYPAISGTMLRVSKTYRPHEDGAKRFARRFGDRLVCVRHRLDAAGTLRYTTIELVAEITPVIPRTHSIVAIRIAPGDRATRALLIASGAQWRSKEKYWLLPQIVAKNLRLLQHRVRIRATPPMATRGKI